MTLHRVLLMNKILLIEMTKTWCVGGRHRSDTINQNVIEKVNPRTKKLFKVI